MDLRLSVLIFFLTQLTFACVTKHKYESSTSQQRIDSSTCQLPQERYRWSKSNYPQLIWISIDSMNLSGLQEIVSSLRQPHPKGFKWLLESKNRNTNLIIREPTITASSHISTLTCSSAGKHGIFANSQWDGSRTVSGFSTPFELETFATSLQRSGLKVVTAAYPALDGSESGRQVSEGFTYGESLSKSHLYSDVKDQEIIHSWSDKNGKSIEILKISDGDPSKIENFLCGINSCIIEHSGIPYITNVTFSFNGRTARAYVQSIQGVKNKIYISQLYLNNSFPVSTKLKQESCGLIFSPGKENHLGEHGAEHWIRGLQHRLSYFDQNWARYLPTTNADVLFLYLEDIDSIRHQYAGDNSAKQIISEHYERVDRVVGEFIASLPSSTNFVILGDHGMSTVKKEINIRRILPEKILLNYQIITSGGTVLFYHNKFQSSEVSAKPSDSEMSNLVEAKKNILNFRLSEKDKPIFEKVLIKTTKEMQDSGLNHKNAPFMIAIANEDFSLQNSVAIELILSDVVNKSGPNPRPRGQHGHAQESEKMKAFLVGWGPKIDRISLKNIKTNIDLVPAIGNAFGWRVPPQCAGSR